MTKYFIYTGSPDKREEELVNAIKSNYPEELVKKVEKLKWHGSYISGDNVVYYPDNCVILNFTIYSDKEILELMKPFGYDVDSYPSSKDLIKDDRFRVLYELQTDAEVPRFFARTSPPSELFLEYNKDSPPLLRRAHSVSSDKIVGIVPLKKNKIPIWIVAVLFGRSVMELPGVMLEGRTICSLDGENGLILEEGTYGARTIYCKLREEHKKLLEEAYNDIEDYLEFAPQITLDISDYTVLGRFEYTLGLVEEDIFLLDISYDHPICSSLLDTKNYCNLQAEAIIDLLKSKESCFNWKW